MAEPNGSTGEQRRLHSVEQLAELVIAASAGRSRFVVGLVGPPGVGKSTVSGALTSLLDPAPPIVGMDGFHLANQVLVDRGLIDRKGAPDTFDADGFVAILERLRSADTTVWCPRFDRSIEDSIGSCRRRHARRSDRHRRGQLPSAHRRAWDRVADLLDLAVYLDLAHAATGRPLDRSPHRVRQVRDRRQALRGSLRRGERCDGRCLRSRAGATLTLS
ncbi:MAG: hypothetical protein R2710_00395 [Acidimicrobiales bacterium]